MSTDYPGGTQYFLSVSYSFWSEAGFNLQLGYITETQAKSFAVGLIGFLETQRSFTDTSWGTPSYLLQNTTSDNVVYEVSVTDGEATIS
jgi:hypothetical protein